MTGLDQFELILGLLTATVLLSAAAPYFRVPPAATFVVGGMALALIPGTPAVEIGPDLVLVLFLPPLLQASAFLTVWRDFRAQLRPILMLAVGAVGFTTMAVGVAAKLVVPDLSWAACFTLGAIVSPPDAVAAKAVLQTLRLPRRIVTILEGESLINDATGLVLYRFAVAAALSGTFSAGEAAASFAWLCVGGVGIGLIVGAVTIAVLRRLRDPHLVVVVSFLVCWASYIAAEHAHASGVLAVVADGLIMGSLAHETLTAKVRTQARAVWNTVIYVLEALVFVLIGLSLRGVVQRMGVAEATLHVGLPLTAAVTLVAVLSRFAWVFPAVYLPRLIPSLRRRDPAPPLSVPFVLSWAGMRGVVSLAAALALPDGFPGRDPILLATFGVILATVLLQGATLGPLVRALRLASVIEPEATMSEHAARAHVAAAFAAHVEAEVDPATGAPLHPRLLDEFRARARATARFHENAEALEEVRRAHFDASLAAVAHGRRALYLLHKDGRIHDTVLHAIEAELDLEELHLHSLAGDAAAAH